jgi:Domain of unknown function (DUF4136)
MKAYLQIAGLLALIIFTACSTVKVSQDYSPDVDFSTLKKFNWKKKEQKKTGDARIDNPLLNTRIRNAVEHYLAEKGHQKASNGNPDFYVSYEYMIESKIVSDNSSVGFGVGRSSRGRYGGLSLSSGGGVSERDEATMLIDFTDAATANLTWRGTGTRRTSQHLTPKQKDQEIKELVEKILNQFPPLP